MDTENTASLTAPCEFFEWDYFYYGRGNLHPGGFPTKDRPDCDRSGKVCLRDVGISLGPRVDLRVQ
jgi:hypothetical protein